MLSDEIEHLQRRERCLLMARTDLGGNAPMPLLIARAEEYLRFIKETRPEAETLLD